MSSALTSLFVEAAKDKKAQRIILLDVRGKSDLCDFQIICSVDSDRQGKAVAEAIETEARQKANVKPATIEGKETGEWILMDYGSVLVHIFLNQLRDYYNLEAIWPGTLVQIPSGQ